MRLFIAVALVLVAGCSQEKIIPPAPDQCMRAELFRVCMAALPKGPESTHYNDWDDVVDSCASTAYYQSLRRKEQIKPECQA